MNQMLTCVALAATIAAFACTSKVSAQSMWTDQSNDRGVTLELVKPQFTGEGKPDFFTAVAYLSGRFSIGPNLAAEVELPVSRYSHNSEYAFDASKTAIGNPYVGVLNRGKSVTARLGLRLPVASDDGGYALGSATLTDYDRFEAFLPDVLTVYTSAMGRINASDQFTIDVGGGPVVTVVTKDTWGDRAEVFAQYALLAEMRTSPVTVRGGFTGRAIVTESDMSLAERSVHQFGLGVTKSSGAFRPGAYLRVPIDDDLGDYLNFVVGVHFTVLLQ